jgi:hypothetical protein
MSESVQTKLPQKREKPANSHSASINSQKKYPVSQKTIQAGMGVSPLQDNNV